MRESPVAEGKGHSELGRAAHAGTVESDMAVTSLPGINGVGKAPTCFFSNSPRVVARDQQDSTKLMSHARADAHVDTPLLGIENGGVHPPRAYHSCVPRTAGWASPRQRLTASCIRWPWVLLLKNPKSSGRTRSLQLPLPNHVWHASVTVLRERRKETGLR
ncbi:uncharacterized protein BDR25DRAFT_14622 [Lindgomyces ingoldianus]|uniref:Uncharacterized protein n=1 Tax=Lindgomyces ingoldianus TaxID=673940 RepID=A0ACB6QZQ1_9PLEO|nr:uncharacterized protein BDR25DRAFT_14622 [Lindgomyces ingoldianus]KAF2472469.1 hypothetical protein BDR25DRAFT_14622 [Lindgomyces ingoldianus]